MITSAKTQLIPRKVLFGNPEKTSPQVSPDGRRMAYLAPVNNVLNVWVGTIGQDDYRSVTNDVERGIRFYAWAADNKHILYLQDVGGNENWRLYATNLESQETPDQWPCWLYSGWAIYLPARFTRLQRGPPGQNGHCHRRNHGDRGRPGV